ncbi:MAG: chlorophyll synthesis pathway protein BchC [Elioraea sp.]|nr:chlorophyll synthesis pathway protein BchC [Elioraea sp.]
MDTVAVLLEEPMRLSLARLDLAEPGEADVVVDVAFSGISTGTERLLWSGRMPPFPGLGYPLVPGYESVGTVVAAGPGSGRRVGETVFVPGSNGFVGARGLFGGAARRIVARGARVLPIDPALGEQGVLLALAATARHAYPDPAHQPDLIVGHGVLGRLLARLAVAHGTTPMVWETNPARRDGATGYAVVHPDADRGGPYRAICDVSGDATILDTLISHLAPQGEIVLAGFYADRLAFTFPPAFMREARIRIAAEWKPKDLVAVSQLIGSGRLSLAALITHHATADRAAEAYKTAFTDPACLKMVLDWRGVS